MIKLIYLFMGCFWSSSKSIIFLCLVLYYSYSNIVGYKSNVHVETSSIINNIITLFCKFILPGCGVSDQS